MPKAEPSDFRTDAEYRTATDSFIESWLHHSKKQSRVFRVTLDESAGYSVKPPNYRNLKLSKKDIFIKLIRYLNAPLGYYIRTAHPRN